MAASPESQVALIFALGTLGMLVMAITIILFVAFYQKRMIQEQLKRQTLEVEYQKKMLEATLESQEIERKRVSKDLHDDVGMMLMTIRTQINLLAGKTLSQESMEDIRQVVDATHDTVRKISWDLMPATLDRFGLSQTVKELCSRITSPDTVVEFSENGKPTRLDKNQEMQLYRIIQESVSNAVRHAKATRIDIWLIWETAELITLVKDDGIGFEFQAERNTIKQRQGLGLINLENRVSLLGGNLQFTKNSPSGTAIKVNLPIQRYA